MHELIVQVLEELRSALRFRWYGMLAAWAVCLGGWAWVATQPDVFEASARVYVDTSSILQPVLGNRIVTPNVATQLAYIREALLGREEMEAVARDAGLDSSATTTADYEAVIANLQSAVQIQSAGGPRNSADGVYNIRYRHSDRAKAMAVVNAILDNFIESAYGANQTQGDTAEKFLDDRVAEYERRLGQAEEERAKFMQEHAGSLPGNEGGYYARMQNERDALEGAKRQLTLVQSRRAELAAQLRGERSENGGGLPTGDPPPGSIDARILDYQTRLDELLLEYTEQHPDVIRLRQQLNRLLAQREDQLAALGADESQQDNPRLESNPIFQRLQMDINAADVEIAQIQADIKLREERVANLQGLINEVPEVEAQLARLNRDYQVIYEQYLALVRSRETQELTRQASEADNIDFKIINPPLAPLTPVAPDRMILLAAVFAAAIGVGAAVCYLLAQLRPVFSSSAVLRQQTGIPVLGAVTNAWPELLKARRRWSLVLYSAASLALFAVFGTLAGIELVGPGLRSIVG